MNIILYCAVTMIYLSAPPKPDLRKRVNLAYAICKQAHESNGCLLEFRLYENIAKIKCGKR